jgi:hypothetical protein
VTTQTLNDAMDTQKPRGRVDSRAASAESPRAIAARTGGRRIGSRSHPIGGEVIGQNVKGTRHAAKTLAIGYHNAAVLLSTARARRCASR